MMEEQVKQSIVTLCEEIGDFWQPLHAVARVDVREITPLQFYRQYVSKSIPVILTHCMESEAWRHVRTHWPSHEYLAQKAGDTTAVTVDITPFGFGDAVLSLTDHDQIFVMPEEREMPMREFLRILADRDGFDGVPYLSHQVSVIV